MPSEQADEPGRFDRLADLVDKITSKASFFAFCLGMVIAWAVSFPAFGTIDTWQLVINTSTTIITFLLVALGANTARRAWAALHAKLNAIVVYLLSDQGDSARRELREALGLENRESSG